ncbi:MAG: 4-hydroxybenzoate octaprenyltransferase [Nitrospinae bacterium RIFCSPLOWO2_02_39_17]|nr:MAG: 4-hydroxybenzoate octaprenyltransferase [Nitrospinae bacterium RIFCSPHIGHO2_02_39_11]OGV98771.1 MAG: 4-hydroxybenzoate octaprenyltransferase [Nitrospinae bacterium RIFCSPHIGHO2_12_FULL_39_42]OGW06498.1 MAG: 4-hydroxybenzoate octaprenyltransferase [Nitrospinae bacterium RIFCSPLOWO2_02_39_17]OGW09145.1 MAG: 4-hydroxybenzoate octaprenyltransferase [Nitrospinae bacterium RIFCSPLOWO2_12_39_15]OGW09323.1 MAG: 4-hydroxybenzoate octaprenyltransferase [Nitrospinae bacterium RIFCSPLOWO2_12_FULL_3
MLSKIKTIFEDIKIQHTVFALPFALMSAFMASNGIPPLDKLLWILLAMVGARSAAMSFNRIADADYDRENPRTKERALPKGEIKKSQYLIFLIISTFLFLFSCLMLNRLALILSPIALLIVFFYSYTKRFTIFSHFFLGLSLSLAPIGAWVAIREEISIVSIVLGLAVIFWLAGLDIIYSCQDVEFDKSYGLFSFPARLDIAKALKLSALFHTIMILLLFSLIFLENLGLFFIIGVVLIAGLLLYEHSIVRPDDLSRVNVAFFNVNGIISIGLMIITIIDIIY